MEEFNSSGESERKNTLRDKIRRKAAPLIVAGISAFVGGNALAKDMDHSTENIQNTELSTSISIPEKSQTFSPENIAIVNSAVSTINTLIQDFTYSVEKDERALSAKIDDSIFKIQGCISSVEKISNKKLAQACSVNADKIIDLLKDYRASHFTNTQLLAEALHVRDIMQEYTDTYNAAHNEYLADHEK